MSPNSRKQKALHAEMRKHFNVGSSSVSDGAMGDTGDIDASSLRHPHHADTPFEEFNQRVARKPRRGAQWEEPSSPPAAPGASIWATMGTADTAAGGDAHDPPGDAFAAGAATAATAKKKKQTRRRATSSAFGVEEFKYDPTHYDIEGDALEEMTYEAEIDIGSSSLGLVLAPMIQNNARATVVKVRTCMREDHG